MLMRIERADRVTDDGNALRRPPPQQHASRWCLSLAATAFGLGWLVLILGALLWEGFSGLSLAVFTEMTPPPGADRRPAQPDHRQPDPDRARRC